MTGGLGPVSAPPSARPAAAAGAASDTDAGEAGFSAALEEAQSPASTPPATSGAAKARLSATAKTAAATTLSPAGAPPPLLATADGDKAGPAAPASAQTARDETATTGDPAAPDLSQLLPGWPAAAPTRASSAPELVSTERPDTGLRRGALIEPLRRELSGMPQAGVESQPAAPSPSASARLTATLPNAAATTGETPPAPAQRAAAETLTALPLPALHAGFMPATAATAPATFEAQLAAALDSPAFAPALATQLTWLVREGVQHARLSLNPAEMGPVTVQIALDGTQARIDFSADFVATRAAIESSLPTLAAALNESGLKLAGGGVFDGQARPGPQGERGDGSPRSARPDGTPDETADSTVIGREVMRTARGLIDLVA